LTIPVKLPKEVLNLFPTWEYRCPCCSTYVESNVSLCPNCKTPFNENKWRVPPRFLKNPEAMSEYAHKVLVPKLTQKQRELLFQYFTEIFSDGFESGDFSEWTGTQISGTSTLEVNSDNPYQGTYNAEAYYSAGEPDGVYSYENIGTSYSTAYIRGYVKYASISSGTNLILPCVGFWVEDHATNTARGGMGRDGSGNAKWAIRYYDGGSFYNAFGSHEPSADTWYCVELKVSIGSSVTLQLYVNGDLEIEVTNVDNSARQFSFAHFGIDQPSGTINAFTVYGDSVVVADTYIGPEEEGGQELDQENDYIPEVYNIIHNAQWIAQGFQSAKNAPCDKVKLYVYKIGSPSQPLTVAIYSDDGSGKPNAELAAQDFAHTKFGTSAGVKVTLEFSGEQATMVSGTKFHIVLKTTLAYDANNNYNFGNTGDNTGYPDGICTYTLNQGSSWNATGYDNSFQQYVMIITITPVMMHHYNTINKIIRG